MKTPPALSSFLLTFIAEQMSDGTECPMGQFGSVFLAVSPPKNLLIPRTVVQGDVGEMSLVLCQCCSQ